MGTPLFYNGQSYEGYEGDGRHEGNEGDEEEANLCQTRKAPCLRWQDQQDQEWVHRRCLQEDQDWQDCQQEGQRPGQGRSRPLGCSSPEGPQVFQHQGFLSHQEGHSTLQEGQGALRSMSAASDLSLGGKGLQLWMWGYLRPS